MREFLIVALLLAHCGAGCSRVSLPAPGEERHPAPHPAPTCDDTRPAPFVPPEPIAPLPLPDPVSPQPAPAPQPAPHVETEQDYWDAIAERVEQGLVPDTDVLLLMADMLKADGRLTDLSRVQAWRPKRVEITDANRAAVAKQLRGG